MATIKGVSKNKWYLQIDYSSKQDVSKNQSTITMTLKVYDGTGYSQNEDYHSAYYIIQGEKRWNPYNYSSIGLKTLGSKTVTVSHNQDGTGSVTLSGSWDCGFASDYTPRTLTVSGKVTLPTIPRASSVTCPSTNIGSTAKISISRASSSFTHTLQYKMSDESSWTNIVTKTTSTSYSWTVPTSFYSKIPNNKSIAGKINCITYSGTTKVGEKTCDFTATVNESANKPTITYSIDNASDSETRALTGNADTFISNFSTAYYSIVATPKNSAKITEVQILCGDKKSTSTYSSDGAVTKDGSFSSVTSASFTINVKDSRGYTVSTTITKTLVNYVAPTCILAVDTFTAAKATLSIKGSCFNSKFGSSGQQNSISLQYRYKESGGSYSGWANVTPTYSGNTYSASKDITGLDYKKTYVFQARVNDLAKTTYIESQEITKSGTPVFDWDKNDFKVNVDFRVTGATTLDGNLTGKYLTGTWLQTTAATDLNNTPPKVAVLDGSGWIYSRTPNELKSDMGLSNIFISQTISPKDWNIPANSTRGGEIKGTFKGYEGYTPILTSCYCVNSYYVAIINSWLTGSYSSSSNGYTWHIDARNFASSKIAADFAINILWIKTNLFR